MTTSASLSSASGVSRYEFAGLESYTRSEAALWNWRQQFLGGERDWKAWIQDAWGDLLLTAAGLEIGLVQANSVETGREPRRFTFKQREILIGRDPSSDIVLDTLAAGKRHARILVENGRCFLEDLGSSLGTYWNQVRVLPNQRHVLQSGDQVSIFPQVFTVAVRQLWARQLDVSVYAGAAEAMTWRAFQDTSTGRRAGFAIHVHPIGAPLHLEVSRSFLMDLADRILRPLEIDHSRSVLGPADKALFEFIILGLIERANRDLLFPFQFETACTGAKPALAQEARGICLACSVSLLAATGALRVFLPYSTLEEMRASAPPEPAGTHLPPVTWKFPVSLGSVELSAAELAGLEREDVLLIERNLRLLLPHRFDRGWIAHSTDADERVALSPRNWNHIEIDKYFEREPLNTEDPQVGSPPGPDRTPDLSQLPVRVHVILAETELTLPQAAALAKGTILELDCEKTGTVTLAVNGKVLGQGQLVDVEGRLGVRIQSWRAA